MTAVTLLDRRGRRSVETFATFTEAARRCHAAAQAGARVVAIRDEPNR